jgi:prevent-host-death family protein
MSRTSVTDLKARLSRYLREVRRGGEVEILDHGVPIARLIGIRVPADTSGEERRERLVRSGVLRQGTSGLSDILEQPPLVVPTSILKALEEERADRL